MLNLNHKKLDTWKLGIEFVIDIYQMTEGFPKSEIYGLTNQLRRAAVSIPSNIAEGASRKSSIERKRFYEIARSSLVEIDTQLEIAIKLKYCTKETISPFSEKMNHLFALITQLIKKTN
ncbi:MAG: four helix bundle protein [bacterium]